MRNLQVQLLFLKLFLIIACFSCFGFKNAFDQHAWHPYKLVRVFPAHLDVYEGFSDHFKKTIKSYITVGYNFDVMRHACLVLYPITVYSYGFLFNCSTVGQASDYDVSDVKL